MVCSPTLICQHAVYSLRISAVPWTCEASTTRILIPIFDGAQRYQSPTEKLGVQTAVFLNFASARSWLGVDLETANLAVMRVRNQIRSRS